MASFSGHGVDVHFPEVYFWRPDKPVVTLEEWTGLRKANCVSLSQIKQLQDTFCL